MDNKTSLPKIFLIFLVALIIFACYLIFKPFLVEIIAAAILVSIFYRPYEYLVSKFRGRKHIAALVMCLLIALLIIVPLANFMVYAAQKSVEAYSEIVKKVSENNIGDIINDGFLNKFNYLGIDASSLKGVALEMAKKLKDWLVSGGANLIKGTTSFIVSLILIIFTMFFFFVDGEKMLAKLMYWTPLSNKYDKRIFQKFRNVSLMTMMSTLVTAIAQGLIGAIGFMVIGLPAFFAGVAMGFLSLAPYIGSALIWLPVSAYLLFTGKIWQGIFLLAWGAGVVSTVDNLIRAYVIKGKANVHPIFIIFSILGGIVLFGFWGILFGPLIISLAVTVLHIYELEYESVLEK